MKRNLVYAIVALIALTIAIVAFSLSANSDAPDTTATVTPTTNPTSNIPQTTQLQIRITCESSWNGTYADIPLSAPIAVDINGSADKTIIIDRPIVCLNQWVLTVTAQKQAVDNHVLTVSILKMDGTLLNTASTSSTAPVSVNAIVQD